MQSPYLIVIAGCNGSGKSTFSKVYSNDTVPFDYDKRFMENYNSLIDSEFRDIMARNQTTQDLESSIRRAFSNKENFSYETNFDNSPMEWVKEAKGKKYITILIFFCLDSIDLAKTRVKNRTENNGHFVADDTISYKWKEGYKNLNKFYSYFDSLLLVDNSTNEYISNIVALFKNESGDFDFELYCENLPDYAERRFPEIYNLISKN